MDIPGHKKCLKQQKKTRRHMRILETRRQTSQAEGRRTVISYLLE